MSAPKRVLYVEDSPSNFQLVRKVLESTGQFTVIEAASAEDGLLALAKGRPDVVLVDLDLPGMSGFDLAKKLKSTAAYAAIPIIAISASVLKHERERAIEVGCTAFVEKPFDIDVLRSIVQTASAG